MKQSSNNRGKDRLLSVTVFKTPLGWAGISMSGKRIRRIVLPQRSAAAVRQELEADAAPREKTLKAAEGQRAVRLLAAYLAGRPVSFDLPLDLGYYTPFQRSVWKAAAAIPFGQTRSYAWIARKIGKPGAARAVGQALGANPIPVIIPCHRVISASGRLGGFSGGLGMKRKLLELEGGSRGDAVKGRRGDRTKET